LGDKIGLTLNMHIVFSLRWCMACRD